MRWEQIENEPDANSFLELTVLRYFSWGHVLTGISEDPRLPGRYVLIFRDETEHDGARQTWFIFRSAIERIDAELQILRWGSDDLHSTAVPAHPRPPRRPASNALALE